jgi:hypothetical protein
VRYTQQSLIALVNILSIIAGVPFPRDFTRRRTLVFKWFDDHFDRLAPIASVVNISSRVLDVQPYRRHKGSIMPDPSPVDSEAMLDVWNPDDQWS